MIMHIDMNAYFATLEQQWNPKLRGKPIIVCGKGSGERTVVATASCQAKWLGIKNGMAVWQAKKLCPEVLLVPAQYPKYLATTRKIIEILESFTPDVEVFSIDEAFLKINPKSEYLNSKQYSNYKSKIPNFSDFGFRASNFETQILQILLQVSLDIKNKIKKTIGELCTCSIGIASNKLLAKIASEFRKPDGLTIVIPVTPVSRFSHPRGGHILTPKELLESIELGDIPGIGSQVVARLSRLGITTVPELYLYSAANYQYLVKEFGLAYAQVLYNVCRGIDDSPLVRFRDAPAEKSFGHSYTLPKEIYTLSKAKAVLLHLAEKVGVRMRRKKLLGSTVHVWLRFTDMSSWGQQTTLSAPTNDGYEIYKVGERLIRIMNHESGIMRPIRAVGISCGNLSKVQQLPLFPVEQKRLTIPHILDAVNTKHGPWSLLRAEILPTLPVVENIPDGRNRRAFLT